jgi:hypothetical protein
MFGTGRTGFPIVDEQVSQIFFDAKSEVKVLGRENPRSLRSEINTAKTLR